MERKKELDFMNVFLCLIVVFIHIASESVSNLQNNSWQFLIVYIPHKLSSFVVYGFIFISSVKLFIKDEEKINIPRYYKGRLKKVIIPYLISVCIYYFYFIVKGYFDFSFSNIIKHFLIGDLVAHFYFVIIITQFYLLYPILKSIIKKIKPVIGITISFMITFTFTRYLPLWLNFIFKDIDFIYNDRIFTTYLFYWVLGAYVGLSYKKVLEYLKVNKRKINILYAITAILYLFINYSVVRFNVAASCLDIIQMIYVTIAIVFLYSNSIRLSKNENIYNLIIHINKSTYMIYLYHILIIFITTDLLNEFLIFDIGNRLIIKLFLVYFVLIIYSFSSNLTKKFIK